jgi:hypothetical protein
MARRQIGRLSQLVHIFLVAAVAGCPQLPDQPSELIQAFGIARLLGQLRAGRGALIEIRAGQRRASPATGHREIHHFSDAA